MEKINIRTQFAPGNIGIGKLEGGARDGAQVVWAYALPSSSYPMSSAGSWQNRLYHIIVVGFAFPLVHSEVPLRLASSITENKDTNVHT
jgi:hypothetical protein